MSYLIIIIALLCGYKIYRSKGQARFDWFVCCVMLFSSSIILVNKPQMPCHRFFMLCYWLSLWRNHELRGRKFPLAAPLAIYSVGILITGFHSEHLTLFYKIYKPVMLVIDTYLVVLLGFLGTRSESLYSKRIVNTLLFVTAYGIITLVMFRNPIQEFVSSAFGQNYLTQYYWGARIRICSTWSHPIAYGLVCSALFMGYLKHAAKGIKIKVLLVLLAFNVLVCGSRTALAAFLIMGMVVLMMRYKIAAGIKVGAAVFAVALLAYLFVPMVQDKVDSVILTAMGYDPAGGSSLEMRETQTEAAMLIVSEEPELGHGIDYIGEVMEFGTDNFTGDWQLLGFESYAYILLIERGFFGFFLEIFILCAILLYSIKSRKWNMTDSSFIISAIIGFAFFSVSTGTLDTFVPIMFLVGAAMSKVQNSIILSYGTKKLGHIYPGL